jgi:hypothetical protein
MAYGYWPQNDKQSIKNEHGLQRNVYWHGHENGNGRGKTATAKQPEH